MTPDEISRLAFLLYPNIAGKELDEKSTTSLGDKIKRLQRGLLPEDEFAATIQWLGNCAGVYRIDQNTTTSTSLIEKMRAPDFVAFAYMDGRTIPVLVEVKTSDENRLDWSEKYLTSLRNFAECVNMPLLIAWKYGDLWTLVDHHHFDKNITGYRLTFEKALTEDLYCVLFRNLRIQMNPKVEMIIDAEILDEVEGGTDTLLPPDTYRMKISNAGFYFEGNKIEEPPPNIFLLRLATPDDVELRRTGKQECQQIFRPLVDHGFTLSNVLIAQLSLVQSEDPINWHQIVAKGEFPSSGREIRDSLKDGIEKGFIRYVMDIIPNTWPPFLPKPVK